MHYVYIIMYDRSFAGITGFIDSVLDSETEAKRYCIALNSHANAKAEFWYVKVSLNTPELRQAYRVEKGIRS